MPTEANRRFAAAGGRPCSSGGLHNGTRLFGTSVRERSVMGLFWQQTGGIEAWPYVPPPLVLTRSSIVSSSKLASLSLASAFTMNFQMCWHSTARRAAAPKPEDRARSSALLR